MHMVFIPNIIPIDQHKQLMVYLRKCSHCFVVLCFVMGLLSILNEYYIFTHILPGCFTHTGATLQLVTEIKNVTMLTNLPSLPVQPAIANLSISWSFHFGDNDYHSSPNTRHLQAITSSVVTFTNWGRVTHTCVSKIIIIGSDNSLLPGRHQAIIWTNVGILWIGPLGTNFSKIFMWIWKLSFKKMHLKISSVKCQPLCLGLNVLKILMQTAVCLYTTTSRCLPICQLELMRCEI